MTTPLLKRLVWILILGCVETLVSHGVSGADPRPSPGELPRITPLSPDRALGSFRVAPGFRLQLAASEPLVEDPIAMAFDERGRLFVVELRGYPEKRAERLGRIKLLEDSDQDGLFDRATVFAEGLGWPSAVICYDGGVFVGVVPDLLFLKDTDGDGVADERRVVFTGFSAGSPREIAPRLFNSLRWGLDNRIYGASSMNGGRVRRPDSAESEALDLGRHDFSFDPRTLDLRRESGSAQHGLTFDLRGTRYASRNSNHIQSMVYDWRYAERNPDAPMPHWRVDIAKEGPAAPIFRISPPEPWRVLRTRWRVAGDIPGPVEGGGTAFGYFTSASGVTVYRGDAFPPDLVGQAFIGAPANNLVHRKRLGFRGAEPVAWRQPEDANREFIASTDNWFRPVQFANAPDGCLYIADMYRETIEVAHAIPESIKARQDVYSGNDRGRIYRVVPEGRSLRPPVDLSGRTTAALAALLSHPNGWHRDTAARLLYERDDPALVPQLDAIIRGNRHPQGRIHALHFLSGLGRLEERHLILAMADLDPGVRQHAVGLLEGFLVAQAGRNDGFSSTLSTWLQALARDPDGRVRLQLAFALAAVPEAVRAGLVASLAEHPENDRWIDGALLSSLATGAGAVFEALISTDRSPRAEAFLKDLVHLIGRQNLETDRQRVLQAIQKSGGGTEAFLWVAALLDGLEEVGGRGVDIGSSLLAEAPKVALDRHSAIDRRLAAMECLGHLDFETVETTVSNLLQFREDVAVQQAAISVLNAFSSPRVASLLLDRWARFTPVLRTVAMDVLLRRASHAKAVLQAVADGTLASTDIPFNRANGLRRHRDPSIRDLANRVLGDPVDTDRVRVIERFRAALGREPNRAAGREIFRLRCQTCHRFQDEGHALGPDLETVRAWSGEELLVHILDPNRKVEPSQRGYELETNGGLSYTGLVVAESAGQVRLRMPLGQEIFLPRQRIRALKGQGGSLMPEGLEEGLDLQGMADLIGFLQGGR